MDEVPPLPVSTPGEANSSQTEAELPITPKAPPPGRKFPCINCGARLDYDPTHQGLSCPYCGYREAIEQRDAVEILERDYQSYLEREEAQGSILPDHTNETTCTGCGATVLLEDKVATDACPFCTTHLEANASHTAEKMIPPESLAPFLVDLRQARTAFQAWLSSLWFAPNELVRAAALGKFTGVYLPYWTYDAMTYTIYEGERGDNYTTTESYTVRNAQGNFETRTRTVVRIRWRYASGQVNHFFDDVLVPATKSLPPDRLAGLDDWKLKQLVPFDAAYLAGFQTERYAVGLQDGLKKAKQLMEPTINQLIRRQIGGDHQRIHSKRTRYSGITFKHLLLPAWIAAYRYRGKLYQITVNGQTGYVSGQRPYSVWKIFGLILLILLGIAAITGIVLIFQSR